MTDRLAALVVVALCVLGLAFAAASLSSAPQERTGTGSGEGQGSGLPARTEQPASDTGSSFEFLPGWLVSVVMPAVVVLSLAVFLVVRGNVLKGGLLAVVFLGLVFLVARLFDGPGSSSERGTANATPRGASGSSGSEIAASGDQFSLALYGAVGLALLVAAGAVVYASRSVDDAADLREDDDPDPDPDAVADAAGRAADAIEESGEADLSNAVYEAWHEMTDAVDVSNPASATPGEFADAAVAAGVDPRPVADLTDVFEAVRYGDEPATHYETRAVEALRRIERDLDGRDDEPGGGTDA